MKNVTINCEALHTPADVHQALAQALSFPDYYGHNLDALFDCLTDITEQTQLTLVNFHALHYAVGDWCGKLLYVFRQACQENPCLSIMMTP